MVYIERYKVQHLTLQQTSKAQSEIWVKARWGKLASARLQPIYLPKRDPVPAIQEGMWAPRLVWKGTDYITATEIFF